MLTNGENIMSKNNKLSVFNRLDLKRSKIVIGIVIVLVITLITFMLFKNELSYNNGISNIKNGNYEEAREIFISLDDYKESSTYLLEIDYQIATNFYNQLNFDEAIKLFSKLKNLEYKDSNDMLKQVKYSKALNFYNEKKFEEAYQSFSEIKDYKDSEKIYYLSLDNIYNNFVNKCWDENKYITFYSDGFIPMCYDPITFNPYTNDYLSGGILDIFNGIDDDEIKGSQRYYALLLNGHWESDDISHVTLQKHSLRFNLIGNYVISGESLNGSGFGSLDYAQNGYRIYDYINLKDLFYIGFLSNDVIQVENQFQRSVNIFYRSGANIVEDTVDNSDNIVTNDSDTIVVEKKDADYINKNVYYKFTTTFPTPNYSISDEDYKKYTEIMDYLWEYPSKSDTELYKELAPRYNTTAEKLDEFIMNVMSDAINRDQGRGSDGSFVVKDEYLEEVLQKFFDINFTNINVNENEIVSEKGLLNILSTGVLNYNNKEFNFIIKTEVSSDLKEFTIYDFKVDDIILDNKRTFRSIFTVNGY